MPCHLSHKNILWTTTYDAKIDMSFLNDIELYLEPGK